MEKTIYEVPSTRILEIRVQGSMLTGSVSGVQRMTGYDGGWDEEDY